MTTSETTPQAASHLIGGQKKPSTSGEGIEVLNPATGKQIGFIPAGTPEDATAAVAAAREALPGWSRLPAAERAALIKTAARKMRDRAEELARVITLENGKPLDDALGGVEAGIGTLEQYAELGPLHRGKSLRGNFMAADEMVYEPYGVAAVVVPWNDPIAIACGYLGAALVTGNTVVYKPSEKTPLSALWLAAMFDGLPRGVLNLLLGDELAGRPLVAHEDVDLVLFTGSVASGHQLKKAVDAGAELLCGGEVPEAPGFFYPPTVLSSVRAGMAVVDEETFGPVAAVEVVATFDEALEKANASAYGLAAVVLTPDQEHAQRAWRELSVGTVKINAVFGGAPGGAAEPRKASGLGFGYGPELLDEVTQTKVIHYAVPLLP